MRMYVIVFEVSFFQRFKIKKNVFALLLFTDRRSRDPDFSVNTNALFRVFSVTKRVAHRRVM